jgi:Flp pilus assembly protein CpaB
MSYRVRNFVIAAVLALLAGILTTMYVSGYKHRVQKGQGLVSVLVATQDVPTGTPAASAHLAVRKLERRNLVAGALADDTKLAGLVSQQPIYSGEQVSLRRFTRVTSLGPRGAIHGHTRIVSVAGDSNQLLSGVLRGGDHVDVIAALPSDATGNTIKPTHILLRNVLVLRPAQQVEASSKLGSGGLDAKLSVLLAVADKNARKLFYAMQNGEWTLALRPIDGSAR